MKVFMTEMPVTHLLRSVGASSLSQKGSVYTEFTLNNFKSLFMELHDCNMQGQFGGVLIIEVSLFLSSKLIMSRTKYLSFYASFIKSIDELCARS